MIDILGKKLIMKIFKKFLVLSDYETIRFESWSGLIQKKHCRLKIEFFQNFL